MNFYTSEKINAYLTCIRSLSGELMYLLDGEKECALIDSCYGVGHLKDYVAKLTNKPVNVFLTHGHVDHAMGVPEFERVYLNEKDIPLYKRQCTLEERKGYAHAVLGAAADELMEEDYTVSEPEKQFLPLEDGMVFKIGDYHLEAYEFPGHTKGSMIFLIREMRILILGDACNNSTFLFEPDCAPLHEYQRRLKELRDSLVGTYDRVLLSHHVMEIDSRIMDNVLKVCDEIFHNEADDLPFEFMGMKAYIAKKCNERFEREDGKSGNIIYNKENL